MLFNSLEFLLFLPIVFTLYWSTKRLGLWLQNLVLVIASYFFYGWWDVKFLGLILASTVVDYTIGLFLQKEKNQNKRKILLWISICFNIGILLYFKYFNFFIESLTNSLEAIGIHSDFNTLSIILPVGISFYTFQTLSYSIDIYNKKIKPTKNFIAFAAFVAFFPQLVAGPIERASNLIPQFVQKRVFNFKNALFGIQLILWGLFKKIAIADALAPSVNEIFANHMQYSWDILLLGACYFSFQIYCDFSGYSNIARGLAKLFGFELMLNFNFPYFAQSISEFWRRWHISLSTWFRDYVYIPLGGSRRTKAIGFRNVFIIFLVSGLWHGANWTFVVWGLIHALLFLPSFMLNTNRKHLSSIAELSTIKNILSVVANILLNFAIVCLAWVFFRAENIGQAFDYLSRMFLFEQGSGSTFLNPYDNQSLLKENIILFSFILVEWILYVQVLESFRYNKTFMLIAQIFLIILIIISIPIAANLSFIYFQF